MKNLDGALEDMRSILEVEKNMNVLFDVRMLEALTLCQEKDDYEEIVGNMKGFKGELKVFGNVFKKGDYYFYKAVIYTHLRVFDKV